MLPEKKTRFFADSMLGNIAKKLRLAGYNSKYFSNINDDEIIESAKNENRIIISRDKDLVAKSKKMGLKSILITKNDEIGQFLEIAKFSNILDFQIKGDTARCPRCNSETEYTSKFSVKEVVPPKVFEVNERFWKCKDCNQVYWEGTHIANLKKFVGEVNERLE